MVDYSRFDGIGDSDDDSPAPSRAPAPAAPRPPPNVMDDLEDYFRRMDERRAAAESEQAEAESVAPASVERFSEDELAALKKVQFAAGSSSSYSDCSICLADFEPGEEVVELPCAAKHLFHAECAKAALSRSIFCPLCRVDVRKPIAAAAAAAHEAAGGTPDAPLSPRSLGFTRDGGVILRYEPNPAPDVPRPSYIPRALHSQAGCVEIAYPEAGVARVWRVPRQDEY